MVEMGYPARKIFSARPELRRHPFAVPAVSAFSIFRLLLVFFFSVSSHAALHSQVIVTETFSLGGPCCTCAKPRIDSLLRVIPGVKSTEYNPNEGKLTVVFDKEKTSLISIQLELSVKGYDAGDFAHTPNMGMSSCCGRKKLDVKTTAVVTPPVKKETEDEDEEEMDELFEEESFEEDFEIEEDNSDLDQILEEEDQEFEDDLDEEEKPPVTRPPTPTPKAR